MIELEEEGKLPETKNYKNVESFEISAKNKFCKILYFVKLLMNKNGFSFMNASSGCSKN